MVEINNISESYNPVFKRRELSFFIDTISQSSPKLYEVRMSLAKQQSVSEDTVYVLKLNTKTGTNRTYGSAEIYDSSKTAKKVVPKHIQIRNSASRREKEKSRRQVREK